MENKIRFSEVLKKYTMVIVLALVIILFTVNTGGKMLLPQNVNNLIVQNAYVFTVSYTHLIDVCMKAMRKVDEARQKRSDDLKIREKLETVVPILESGYLYNILLADSFHNYNDNYRQFLVIEEKYGFMIVLEFGDSEENGVLTNAVGISVRAEKFYPQLREIAKEFFHCLVGPCILYTSRCV